MDRGLTWGLGAVALAFVVGAPGLAAAQTKTSAGLKPPPATTGMAAPTSQTFQYSRYEVETIHATEEQLGALVDPAPEGKVIERLDILTLEVIEVRDPAPRFLNYLHVVSRPYVIEREVLLKEGDAYRQILVDETARNLRVLPQLSLVVCIPLKGSTPDSVRLAVVTKDVWSLRLSWDVAYTPGGIERLLLQPGETNLAGTQQSVAARFLYQPESYAIGARYNVPRLFGSRVAAGSTLGIVMNRARGQPEGSYGSLDVGLPLYATYVPWAWGVSGAWADEVARRYVNAQLGAFDAKSTPAKEAIPFEYRSRNYAVGTSATRSFGWGLKHDLSVGFTVSAASYDTVDTARFDPAAVAEFRRTRVPANDTRVGPSFQYRTYSTNYLRVLDFETLGLQEDYRLGHDFYFRVYPVTKALGSSRNFVGFFVAGQYTVPLRDGLARLAVESLTEVQHDAIPDASISVAGRIMSPRLGFGRLVFDAAVVNRYRNFLTRNTFLGGDTRLRGYPSNAFVGRDYAVYNLEFRTPPAYILSCQVGAVAFYDAGDAFDGFENRRMKHSAGGGLRVLFPQLDRTVFRGDIGVPLEPHGLPPGVAPVSFYIGFGQAFGVPTAAP